MYNGLKHYHKRSQTRRDEKKYSSRENSPKVCSTIILKKQNKLWSTHSEKQIEKKKEKRWSLISQISTQRTQKSTHTTKSTNPTKGWKKKWNFYYKNTQS